MNRKNLPLLLMLAAGAVTCVITYVMDYPIMTKLVSLFLVLVLFYSFGSILKWTLDRFDRQNEEKKEAEGAEDGSDEKNGKQETVENSGDTKKEP